MQSVTNKIPAASYSSQSNNKVFKFNDYPAIQCRTFNNLENGLIFIEENSLIFVTKGSIKIKYGKSEYSVSKSQLGFLKKDITVEYETRTEQDGLEKVEYILILLKGELVREFTRLAELHVSDIEETSSVAVSTVDKKLAAIMDSIELYLAEPEKVEGSLIKIKLLELLFCMEGSVNVILKQVLDLREHFRADIRAVVEENIMNSLSLHELAVMAGRSLSSFRRDFLAIYNMPPSQWIRQKKLEKAQELLLSTTMTVTDICYTTGFENIAHFSRLFKSQFRYSPSDFRLNMLVA